MPSKKQFIKSVDIDIDKGFIHIKRVTQIIDDDGVTVLVELPHRTVKHVDDPDLDSAIDDPILAADVKKIAMRSKAPK